MDYNSNRAIWPAAEPHEAISAVDAAWSFATKLAHVRQLLMQIADTLDPHLGMLVHLQIEQAEPHLRAGVVFAVASGDSDSEALITQRIHLAAALEMLYVAVSIHSLLVEQSPSMLTSIVEDEVDADADGDSTAPLNTRLQDTGESMDKMLMGTIILAGDYCFSQSADLAVRTDSPEVVTIFSKALKELSEQQLRSLLPNTAPIEEDYAPSASATRANELLFRAALDASFIFRPVSAQEAEVLSILCQALLNYSASGASISEDDNRFSSRTASVLNRLSPSQRARWRALFDLCEA